jgi:hypothetical protein
MKTLKLILLVFLGIITLNGCTPSSDEARTYNDQLMLLENPLSEKENAFIEQLSSDKSADKIKVAYDELMKQSEETISNVEKIEAFDNNSEYLNAAKEYFKTIKSLVDNEYKAMAALAAKNPEEITDEDSKKYDELALSVEEKSKKVLEKVQNEQHVFASKYKFEIEKASD